MKSPFSALHFLNQAKQLSQKCDRECKDHYQADYLVQNYQATSGPDNCLHHGFTLAFFWLLQAARSIGSDESLEALYTVAIAETIKLGGDVRSNVAIVGGLLGALIGFTRIPRSMTMNLLRLGVEQEAKEPEYENEGVEGSETKGGRERKNREFFNIRKHLVKNID